MKSKLFQTRPRITLLVLLFISLVGGLILGARQLGNNATAQADAPPTPSFTSTDDATVQLNELVRYVESTQQPRRVVQVDLAQHPKISQFTDIDSSAQGYGKNACGLVAAAAALGGKGWQLLVAKIAQAAGKNYDGDTGIQPSPYTAALQTVFGASQVQAAANSTLGDLYRELAAKRVVIVDIKVNALGKVPSVLRPNYAHFARVLGLDLDRQEIYIENTLVGDPYWTVSFTDFVAAWLRPETTASDILVPREAEEVTRWMVSINPKAS